MTAARRQSPQRLTAPAGPVDGTGAREKMQGKIKGRGTWPRGNPVCTWGSRSTRQEAAACRESEQCRVSIGAAVCFARRTAVALDGVTR
jgi:hypothetical protein